MHRIDGTDAAISLPTPSAPGTPGYFQKANPGIGQRGTVVTADWANTVQEEISNVIEGAGITLDKTDNTQLYDAIQAIIAASTIQILPKGPIYGLVISNNALDSNNDIDVAVGECVNSSGTRLVKLNTPITKRLDATWAVGNNNGGLATGSKASSTTYHVFLIRKTADGTIDAMFDTSLTGANVPSGWTAERRIGSVKTNGSSNLYQFDAVEVAGGALHFALKAPVLDATYSAAGNNTFALTQAPTGIILQARMQAFMIGESNSSDGLQEFGINFYEVAAGTQQASSANAPLLILTNRVNAQTYDPGAAQAFVHTNTSAQVGVSIYNPSAVHLAPTTRISCTGFTDFRRA